MATNNMSHMCITMQIEMAYKNETIHVSKALTAEYLRSALVENSVTSIGFSRASPYDASNCSFELYTASSAK